MNYLKQYADALPAGIIQTGCNKAEPSEIALKAGKLTLKFSNGALRYISSGNNEIIRMIYAAVRDKDWLTIIPVISDEDFDIKSNSFHIRFICKYVSGDIDFTAQIEITGNQDNSITLCMEGKANKVFQRNRIGFCVLHPIESCAGKSCLITHTNGIAEESAFPDLIQPHHPFTDIRSMSWPVSGGRCCLNFEGDIFETEDQRNWTDASFKTYSTPLSLPYPVKVTVGTIISQRIEFRVESLHADISSEEESVNITLYHGKFLKLPMIGIARTTRSKPLTDTELRILRSLRFDHYRINVHLFEDGWQVAAGQAIAEAAGLAAKVEFALFFDINFEVQIRVFIEWFSLKRPLTYCILIFHRSYPATPGEIVDKVIPVIRKEAPWIKIGIGTNANFAELNRNRPASHEADLECFSIQPQEHAFDKQTLVENLKAQEYVVKSAIRFSEGHGIWISPVNIRRRFNANKTFIEEPFSVRESTLQADARIMSLFGACWTAISLKYLCENEIAGVTFYETVGENGIMQGENNSRWPLEFPSYRGMIFPVYFIFKYLQKYRSLRVIRSSSSRPLVTDSFSLTDGKQVRIILTNFTSRPHNVKITGCKGLLRIKNLNTGNFAEAVTNYNWAGDNSEKVSRSGEPLSLEPFSISFVDGWLKK